MNISKFTLVVLAILVAGGFFVWYSSGPNTPTEESEQETVVESQNIPEEPVVVISYTNDGYEPSSVNIKVGDTVRFMNDSNDQQTWPASAVHPTHSVYPESNESDCLGSSFDACRGLNPGEWWDFKFNKVGEWRFHDHIHASKTGVVYVSE